MSLETIPLKSSFSIASLPRPVPDTGGNSSRRLPASRVT
jgi:hypothetical protein